MTQLLIDAGNTRIKWALARDGQIERQFATPTTDPADLARWLKRAAPFDECFGVCVAGEKVERQIAALLRAADRPVPQFLQSTRASGRVTNGYRDPSQLGVDRWAAAIAAWHMAGCYRTVCAASVGTALTIDLVDNDGRHRGGLIAPGPQMMIESLLGNTHGIASRAKRLKTRAPRVPLKEVPLIFPPMADNTRDAITHGSLAAAAGLIDRVVVDITRKLLVRPVLYLTGGGADAVQPLLKGACKPVDDLVLRGVAAMAGSPVHRRARS